MVVGHGVLMHVVDIDAVCPPVYCHQAQLSSASHAVCHYLTRPLCYEQEVQARKPARRR